MKTERRCVPRQRPEGISYFEFEAGSGGIVLDASEKGLAFQAADALHQLGSNRIVISPRPEERIELYADVVWTDRSKKSGGLRFIDPGADSCNRIRTWLKQAGESWVSEHRQEYPLPTGAVEEVRDLPRARSNPEKLPPPSRVPARERRPVVPRPAQNPPPLLNSEVTWQPQDSSGVRHGVLHQIATGFLIAAFVFAGVAFVENFGFVERFRPKVAGALIRLGEKLNGTSDSQTPISSPLPDRPQVPTPPPSAVPSIPDASQQQALRSSDQAHSSAPNHSETPGSAIPRTKEEAHHTASSRTPSFVQGRSVEASRLWSAVEAGSPAAELNLARLYLKGEGVPRNCEQAWILLRAAIKSGSREARQQLQKLRRYGCG